MSADSKLRAMRADCDALRDRNVQLAGDLRKARADAMLAQRDAEISAIKIGHLLAKISRLEESNERLKRLLHMNELKMPPFAPG